MERYTKRLDDGQAVMDCQSCPESWMNKPNSDCSALYCRNRLKDRIAAYEDTGLEPQEITRIVDEYGHGHTLRTHAAERLELIREIPTDRLRELVEADRDGRCVVLPCKVGSKVYSLEDRSYWKDVPCPYENECEVCDTDCHYYRQEMVEETKIAVRVIVSASEMESVMRELGKTVFLTREAAEAALKGEQHG